MKREVIFVLTLMFASAAMAQLTSGVVVRSGAPFPIVADFNGDGLDDLIQETNVILNDGTSLAEVRDLGIAAGEKVIGVLDANGDHRLDLLTVGTPVMVPSNLPQPPRQGPGYRLYLADASRTYSTTIGISTGTRPYIADVDGDGKDDFVLLADVRTNGFLIATDVTVLRSRGDGTFDALETFRIAASPQIVPDHRVLSGDLNHDGLPDLVIRCAQDLVILLGTGGGKFAVKNLYLPASQNFGTQSARLADIDGDSNLDVILPALRGIRVFFGDGRGNFPRTTRAAIAKTHEIELPPSLTFLAPTNINEPRDLALGHFTRSDRMQIAAGTLEGDIVVFSYEQGALREVSRTRTEFWHLDVRSGHFHGSGDDVYAVGTLIWGETYPRPRLFYGSDAKPAIVSSAPSVSRRRATGSVASELSLQMQMRGECIDEAAGQWRFSRDGVFGLAKRGATSIEAVFDGPQVYFRLSAPYAQEPVYLVLTEENGTYSGTAEVMTACGAKIMTINAKVD
jgi:hypothetical protein